MKNTITHYKNCLRVIFDNTPIVPQTSKTAKNQPFTSLTPNYLCLQCTTTTTAQGRISHGTETLHRFCMCDPIVLQTLADFV
jgi:ubiquitin carboxyl-terminal hydrolase 22/27/51